MHKIVAMKLYMAQRVYHDKATHEWPKIDKCQTSTIINDQWHIHDQRQGANFHIAINIPTIFQNCLPYLVYSLFSSLSVCLFIHCIIHLSNFEIEIWNIFYCELWLWMIKTIIQWIIQWIYSEYYSEQWR